MTGDSILPQGWDAAMSESQGCVQLRDHFAELTDPRSGKVTHPLLNIITIAVCAVICQGNRMKFRQM